MTYWWIRGAAGQYSTFYGVPMLDELVEENWDSGDEEEKSVEPNEMESEGMKGSDR